jgi:hypothetical protein
MLVKVYLFLCCSLLLTVAGCRSDTAQQANTPQSSTVASTVATPLVVTPRNTPAQTANRQTLAPDSNSAATAKRVDSCSLLTGKDVQEVQGFEVKDTKGSHQTDGAFTVAQCYYLTAEPSKSVVVTLYDSNPDNTATQTPRDFWKERFGSAAAEGKEKEREREREREREKDKARGKDRDRDRDKDAEKVRDKARKGEIEEEEEAAPPRAVKGVGDEAYWTGNQAVGALYVLKKNSFIRISVGGTDSMETKIKKTRALAQRILPRL